MSDLYHKLGPQGRALLAQNSGLSTVPSYTSTSTSTREHETPQELDYLVNELRNPKTDTTVNKILGYLYNYVPTIKHEQNLRIVIANFLNTPVCFNTGILPSFEENYLIIEVFKLIFDKKLKISIPTIPIKAFYSILLKELKHFQAYNPGKNSWKVLPVLSGALLSNDLRNQLYSDVNYLEYKLFFNEWDAEASRLFSTALGYSLSDSFPNDINYLSLISLALVYKKDQNIVDQYTRKIPSHLVINKLVEMVFLDPNVSTLVYHNFFQLKPDDPEIEKAVHSEIMNRPVVKHLNKLSFLIEACFTLLSFDQSNEALVRDNLIRITQFNKTLNHTTNSSIFNEFNGPKQSDPLIANFWLFMKSLLFSEIIIFQGILTRFITANTQLGGGMFWFGRNQLSRVEYQYKDVALELIPNLYYINFILLSIGQGGFESYNFVYYLTIELALATGLRFEQNTMYLIGNYQEINLHPDVLNCNYLDTSKVIFVLGLWENYLQLTHRQPQFCKEVYNVAIDLVDDRKYSNDEVLEAAHSVLLFYYAKCEVTNVAEVLQYVELLLLQFPKRLSANQLNIAIETLGKKLLSGSDEATSEVFLTLLINKQCLLPMISLIPYIPLKRFLSWVNKIHDLIGKNTEEEKMFWKVLTERLDSNRAELAIYTFY